MTSQVCRYPPRKFLYLLYAEDYSVSGFRWPGKCTPTRQILVHKAAEENVTTVHSIGVLRTKWVHRQQCHVED